MNYITNDNTIIFSPSFNRKLKSKLLNNNYKKIIFADYDLNNDLFEKYKNNDFNDLRYFGSQFNQSINNLPSGITHLTFSYYFNQSVNNLHPKGCSKNSTDGCCSCCPSSITHLTFGYKFNQSVDNLHPKGCSKNSTIGCCSCCPSLITHLTFDYYSKFDQSLNNLPIFTEFIKLPKNYNNKIYNIPKSLKVIKCSKK